MMLSNRALAILTSTAALAFALGPFITAFDGFDPNAYPVPQDSPPGQPAGYAFAIWGPIYLWLLASTGIGLLARADDSDWAPSRAPLLISLTIGAIWLPVAEQSPVWATILIWGMLVSALIALRRAPSKDRWLLQAPIGLYAGWLTAASCVSIALLGAGYDIVFGQTVWAAIAIAIALAITITTLRLRLVTPTYAIAVIWALLAIVSQNLAGPTSIAILAGIGAIIVALAHLKTRVT